MALSLMVAPLPTTLLMNLSLLREQLVLVLLVPSAPQAVETLLELVLRSPLTALVIPLERQLRSPMVSALQLLRLLPSPKSITNPMLMVAHSTPKGVFFMGILIQLWNRRGRKSCFYP